MIASSAGVSARANAHEAVDAVAAGETRAAGIARIRLARVVDVAARAHIVRRTLAHEVVDANDLTSAARIARVGRARIGVDGPFAARARVVGRTHAHEVLRHLWRAHARASVLARIGRARIVHGRNGGREEVRRTRVGHLARIGLHEVLALQARVVDGTNAREGDGRRQNGGARAAVHARIDGHAGADWTWRGCAKRDGGRRGSGGRSQS